MSTGRSDRRSLLAVQVFALAAAIALEGMLVVLPHDHAPRAPRPAATRDDPQRSAPADAHLQREQHAKDTTPCLACAISSMAFACADTTRVVAFAGLAAALPAPAPPLVITFRTWRRLLRAPPSTA